jgi:hypothetical protein
MTEKERQHHNNPPLMTESRRRASAASLGLGRSQFSAVLSSMDINICVDEDSQKFV